MKPIITAIENNPRLTVATLVVALILITFSMFSKDETVSPTIQELEQKVIAEKARLDGERDSQVEAITAQIESLKQCIVQVKKEKQTLMPITGCESRNTAVDAQGEVETSTGSSTSSEAPQA